jgi:hypothetical protein
MFPISEDDLSFSRIADYWSREIYPPASRSEVLDLLIRAWWRGELFGDSASRLDFLKGMFTARNNGLSDDIVFDAGNEVRPRDQEELPDGSVRIDMRLRVPVPSSNTNDWNEALCGPAFQKLSSKDVWCSEHYPLLLPRLAGSNLSREQFMSWVETRYPLPTFWSRNVAADATPEPTVVSTSSPTPSLGRPTRSTIHEAITAVYDEASKADAVSSPKCNSAA